jgi:MTH538 TIR-like domain (DUF1863)
MNLYSPQRAFSSATKRRVFFSFHYQKDINRVNIVRNSWVVRPDSQMQGEGFYDGSIWESAKRHGDDSLKDLIRNGVENTSVTCILAGQHTWARRWVRYEIARSVIKGNGLLTVHIAGLSCMRNGVGVRGPNPLEYMGVYEHPQSGKISLCELTAEGKWVWYNDYISAVSWPVYLPRPVGNSVQPLSRGTLQYDYTAQGGYRNFSGWIATAAADANR